MLEPLAENVSHEKLYQRFKVGNFNLQDDDRAEENPTQKSAERSAIYPTETINDLVSNLSDKILNLEGDTIEFKKIVQPVK